VIEIGLFIVTGSIQSLLSLRPSRPFFASFAVKSFSFVPCRSDRAAGDEAREDMEWISGTDENPRELITEKLGN